MLPDFDYDDRAEITELFPDSTVHCEYIVEQPRHDLRPVVLTQDELQLVHAVLTNLDRLVMYVQIMSKKLENNEYMAPQIIADSRIIFSRVAPSSARSYMFDGGDLGNLFAEPESSADKLLLAPQAPLRQ